MPAPRGLSGVTSPGELERIVRRIGGRKSHPGSHRVLALAA